MFVQEVIDRCQNHLGTYRLVVAFAVWCLAAEIEVPFVFFGLRRDVGVKVTIATRTGHHLTHEVGLSVLLLDDVGERKALGDAILLAEFFKVLDRDCWHEVVFLKQVGDLFSEDHGTSIHGVTQKVGDKLHADDELLGSRVLGFEGITLLSEPRSDVFERGLAQTHGEDLTNKTEVLAIRAEEMRPVFVVAVFGVAARILTFGGLATDGAVHVLAVLVTVLFGHDEANAEEHLARWLVRENEVVGKLQVFDDSFVEEVDNLARFFHVASEAVRCPRDDGVVFACNDSVQHVTKRFSFVRDLGRLFLMDVFSHPYT